MNPIVIMYILHRCICTYLIADLLLFLVQQSDYYDMNTILRKDVLKHSISTLWCLIIIIYCNFVFCSEDLENVSDRNLTIASALATVLSKTFQLKSPAIQSHIEKCPTFVSKEKRPKIFGHRNKKTWQLQGHHFEIKHYFQHTVCTHSQQMIWGIGPQGYKCSRKL